jgi:uncharacterized membrane protein (DUF373 family)
MDRGGTAVADITGTGHDRPGLEGIQTSVTGFVDRWATLVIALVVDALVVVTALAIGWMAFTVARDLYLAVAGGSGESGVEVLTGVLTVFVFIEVFAFFLEFARHGKVSVPTLLDVSLAIVLRELWVGLFSQHMTWQMVGAIAFTVIALGGIRVATVVFAPDGGRTGSTRD